MNDYQEKVERLSQSLIKTRSERMQEDEGTRVVRRNIVEVINQI